MKMKTQTFYRAIILSILFVPRVESWESERQLWALLVAAHESVEEGFR